MNSSNNLSINLHEKNLSKKSKKKQKHFRISPKILLITLSFFLISLIILFILLQNGLLPKINIQLLNKPTEKNIKVVSEARKVIGSNKYSYLYQATSIDGKIVQDGRTFKNGLFIYDILIKCGINISFKKSENWMFLNSVVRNYPQRAFNAMEWYDEKVEGMKLVGRGKKGLKKCRPGDIITDRCLIGIISGNNKVIYNKGDRKTGGSELWYLPVSNVVEENWDNFVNKSTCSRAKIFRYE